MHANANKLDEGEYNDKDNGIIAVMDILPRDAPPQDPIITVPDFNDNNVSTSNKLDSDNNGNDPDVQKAHDQDDVGNINDEGQEEKCKLPAGEIQKA